MHSLLVLEEVAGCIQKFALEWVAIVWTLFTSCTGSESHVPKLSCPTSKICFLCALPGIWRYFGLSLDTAQWGGIQHNWKNPRLPDTNYTYQKKHVFWLWLICYVNPFSCKELFSVFIWKVYLCVLAYKQLSAVWKQKILNGIHLHYISNLT